MSAQRESSMGPRDYISNLPDEILGKILSLLSTNHAACTSVLSKRWKNLLALVDNLDLHDGIGGFHGLAEFMDNTLAVLSNAPPMKRFSLALSYEEKDYNVNNWIRTVLESGCSELYLDCVRFDTEFFMTNLLVKLTLCNMSFAKRDDLPPREAVIFPALKTLSLVSVEFGDYEYGEPNHKFENLVSGCPILEDLSLHECETFIPTGEWFGKLSSPSIKRLTIDYDYYNDYYDSTHDQPGHDYCFELPNLVYLNFSCNVVADGYKMNLASLEEARLDIRSWEVEDWHVHIDYDEKYYNWEVHDDYDESDYEDDESYNDYEESDDDVCRPNKLYGDITDLVVGISMVKTLHLSADSLVVFHFCSKSMPVFSNLLTLSFESNEEKGWQVVPLLLNNSPNLESLFIKGLVHQVTDRCGDACACIPKKKKVCCLSTCQVKVLNISEYRGTDRELKQMRHFLANLKCLETVKVRVKVNRLKYFNNKYMRITDILKKLPRVSSNCQIRFF